MFTVKLRQSIRFRFLSIIASILIVSTIVVSTIIALNEKRMLRNSLIIKGQSFGSYIAKLSQDPLVMKDGIQLDALVNEANKDEDIMYSVIHDMKGNIVTSQYASINYRSPRLKPILSGLPRESGIEDIVAAIRNREAVAELSVPVLSGDVPVGKVTIGMSENKVRRQILMTVLFVVALNLAMAFALGTVLFIASKKIILDPVFELAQAIAALAEGDLGIQVKTRTTGEVQLLVDGFNRMAEELKKRSGELLDAQEELVRREKLVMLGQLAGGVGNELRNPLGVMNNAVFFLKTVLPDADATVQEYLEIIENEIGNSRCILSDFLEAVQSSPPQARRVSLAELVDGSIGKGIFPENITVRVDLQDGLPPLKVDPAQMRQVLQNLISNAVQAMPEGGALNISARYVGAGLAPAQPGYPQGAPLQDFIAISVTDSGTGITPENMTKLFQPLFTTKARGIGLGLVVCKNLVAANGGRIEVESAPGEGTTFTVLLPIERDKK